MRKSVLAIFIFVFCNPMNTFSEENVKKERSSLFTIDFTINPHRQLLSVDRLNSLSTGTLPDTPAWAGKTELMMDVIPPDISFQTKNLRLSLESTFLNNKDRTRRLRYVKFDAENYFFSNLLLGCSGIWESEYAKRDLEGTVFDNDFERKARTGRVWVGAKAGSFHKGFVDLKYFRGYSEVNAFRVYEDFRARTTIYDNIFRSQGFIFDSSIDLPQIGPIKFIPGLQFWDIWYERDQELEDTEIFGANSFRDFSFEVFLEIVPIEDDFDNVRWVLRYRNQLTTGTSLLFHHQPAELSLHFKLVF